MATVLRSLVRHIFGIRPDALNETVVFDPHVPDVWEDMSIEDLPVGDNRVSLSRATADRGIEYTIESADSAWTMVLMTRRSPDARFFLNGEAVPAAAAIRMTGGRNHVLMGR
jgi:hypothetical protein